MRFARLVAATTIAAAASCSQGAPPGESLETTTAAIQYGLADQVDTFEVGVCGGAPGDCDTYCSGTLLAPNLVATARHCIADVPALATGSLDCATATFGAEGNPQSFYVTTNESMSDTTGHWIQAASFVTPTTTLFCGGDLALIILASSVPADAATPAIPNVLYDLRDRAHISRNETAIGYGVTSPTGTDVGERRIREGVPFTCIPDDPEIDCFPQYEAVIAEQELYAGNGPCAGDSGSGAFEQTRFDEGVFLVLGAVSRGGSSTDGTTCEGSVYTRFDSYRDLVLQAATQAAALGAYEPPAWVSSPPIAPFGDAGVVDAGEAQQLSASGGCSVRSGPRGPALWAYALATLAVLGVRRRRR